MNEEASTRAAVTNDRSADKLIETGDKPPARKLEKRANIRFSFPATSSYEDIKKAAGMGLFVCVCMSVCSRECVCVFVFVVPARLTSCMPQTHACSGFDFIPRNDRLTSIPRHSRRSPTDSSYSTLRPTPTHTGHVKGMIDLSKVVVVTGFGEVGPWGNARTRWEMEREGAFSLEGMLSCCPSIHLAGLGPLASFVVLEDLCTLCPLFMLADRQCSFCKCFCSCSCIGLFVFAYALTSICAHTHPLVYARPHTSS